MELKDFTGEHMLSGIDRVEKEDMNGFAFIIDGKQYAVYAHISYGLNSYLTKLEEYKGMINSFPSQKVVGEFKDNILRLKNINDSSLVFRLGTEECNISTTGYSWKRFAIMDFYPENMDVNEKLKNL